MAGMNMKFQGVAVGCLVLGEGRIRKRYEGVSVLTRMNF